MAESTKRKFGGIRTDRISMLPREIQEIILCFLPIRDAVRTSILSKDWRHCWTMIPHRIFDRQFFSNKNKFVSAMNEVLLLHNGPILKFSLRFCDPRSAKLVCDYISRWILLLSRNGIKQLTLENYSNLATTANDFSFLGLTNLRLTRFEFPSTPAYGEFTYLTRLELENVVHFGQSIFNCPVLGKLRLMRCRELSLANFQAPNLKCIYETSDQVTLAELENLIENPPV